MGCIFNFTKGRNISVWCHMYSVTNGIVSLQCEFYTVDGISSNILMSEVNED
jgi:hypothetical protein